MLGQISNIVGFIKMLYDIYKFIKGVIQDGKEKSAEEKSKTFKEVLGNIEETAKIENSAERIKKRKSELKKLIDNF